MKDSDNLIKMRLIFLRGRHGKLNFIENRYMAILKVVCWLY